MPTITVACDRTTVRFIHDDCLYNALTKAIAPATATITRASNVEPNADNSWRADMSPVGGPVLGPFLTRSIALTAEVEWLKANYLNKPQPPLPSCLIQ